jgi:hypothetical protein
MKYVYTFVLVFVLAFSFIKAQIPNAGFENWANSDPVGWYTFDFFGDAVTQTSESHSGSSAAKMEIIDFSGSPFPPFLYSGQFGVSEQFGSLTGYFKFVPQNANEYFTVSILMSKNSSYVGGGAWETYQATSTFTQFVVPIEYFGSEIPDSAYIQIAVFDTTDGNGGIGSYAIIDDLSLGGSTGVSDDQVTINSFKLDQNYPNPFNPSTSIQFQIPKSSFVNLKVYDILGNEVAILVNEEKPAGNYEVSFIASQLSSGIYLYKIQAGSFVETKKMILMK